MIRRKEGIEMKKGLKSLVLLGSISLVGFGLVGCQNVENIAKEAKTKIQQSVRNDDQVIKKVLDQKYNYSDYTIKETLEALAKYRGVSTKVHAKVVDNGKKVKCWIGKEDEYDENYFCIYVVAETGKIYEIDDATVRVDITDPEQLGQYEAENFEGWDTADDDSDSDGEYTGEGLDNADYDGSEDGDYTDEDTASNEDILNKCAQLVKETLNSDGWSCNAYVSGSSIYARVTIKDLSRQDMVNSFDGMSTQDTDETIKAMLGAGLIDDLKESSSYINQQGYNCSGIEVTFLTNDGATIARCSTASGWIITHY